MRAALRARADKALAEAKLRAAAKNCASASADAAGPVGTSTGAQTSPISSELAACRDRSFLQRGSKPRQAALWTSASRAASQGELPAAQGGVPCRFFGSMRGCIRGDACGFSHHEPNSVEMCRFLQHAGCLKGASCLYRHVHWASASEAEAHCAKQGADSVLEAERAWQELHGHGPRQPHATNSGVTLRADAPVYVPLTERYGAPAMKMMQKMGFELGRGMGRHEQGRMEPIPSGSASIHGNKAAGIGFGTELVAERKE